MPALTRLCLRRPLATLLALALVSAALGAGILRLTTDVGYRAFLGMDHPTTRAFDEFLARFGGGLPVAAVWSCRETQSCQSVFDAGALAMAHSVASALATARGVRYVESPATSVLLVPSTEGVAARSFVENGAPVSDAAELAVLARSDPLWVGSLINRDATVGTIFAELASSDGELSRSVFETLDRALAPHEAAGFRFHLVGGPVEFVVAAAELESAARRLIPPVVLIVGGVLWLLFRSLPAVAALLASMGFAVLWTMGFLGWLGWPQNSFTQTLPPLVLVVGVATGIHVLSRYAAEAAQACATLDERRAALERVAADIGPACAFNSLTTAAGFFSFLASGLESITRFGIVAGIGTLAALVLTFTLLPVLLVHLSPRELRALDATDAWRRRLGAWVGLAERRSGWILLFAVAVGIAAAVGMARLRVGASFEDLYGESSQVVRWVRFVEENLRKPDTLEIEVELPAGEKLESPAALGELERLAAFFPSVEGLGRAHSLLEPLSRLNRMLHEGDPAFERPGASEQANAELMLLLQISNARALESWVSLDRRRVRLSVEAGKEPQERLRALMDQVRARLRSGLPAGWKATATGPLAVVHDIIEEVHRTQFGSFATSFLTVLALVALYLRSARLALLAMVPAGLPIALTIGAMGLLGLQLDVGTAMVGAIGIGISIDETIHVLEQYRRRRAAGLAELEAMRETIAHVGRGMVGTSLALAVGFAAFVLSPWDSVANFGIVSAIAIGVALVSVLLLLPALIAALARAGSPFGLEPERSKG